MKKNVAIIFLAVLGQTLMLVSNGASGAERDHLLPEVSIIAGSDVLQGYEQMLRAAFDEVYANDVKFRMVDLPSFHTESITALKEDKDDYQIFTLEPEQQLWEYQALAMMESGQVKKIVGDDFEHGVTPDKEIADAKAALPPDFHSVKMKRCEIGIDKTRGQRLLAAFKAVLLETKYTQPGEDDVVVTDGVQDHFSMPGFFSDLAGWTNFAPQNGKLAALDDTAIAMFDYCAKRNAPALKTLDVHLAELETRMALKDQPGKEITK